MKKSLLSLLAIASSLISLGVVALPGKAATFLYFKSEPGSFVGGGLTKTLTSTDGTFTASRIYNSPPFFDFKNGVEIMFSAFNQPEAGENSIFNYGRLIFTAPEDAVLTPGTYQNATRWPFQSTEQPGLDVSLGNRGCNQLIGNFVVKEAIYGTDGQPERFSADFEQSCEGSILSGQIRFNSSDETPNTSVPEPTMLLGLLAIGGMLVSHRKRFNET